MLECLTVSDSVYVLFLILSSLISLIHIKVSLSGNYSKIEFLRFESVKELDGMVWDAREEERVDWGRGRGKEHTPRRSLNGT